MGKYFGTDGFRGEANVGLTVNHAFKVGRFIGAYYARQKSENEKVKVVIGKDTRLSSYMFEYALSAGLTASGADSYLLHVTTTPCVSYVAKSDDFDCGIMISASHNPYYDNGLKLIDSQGVKIGEDIEALIEEYLDKKEDDLPLAKGDRIGRTVDYSAGRNRYIGYLISLSTRSYKNMRIGLDCANGSSFAIAKSVFDALGAKTYVIHNEPNGTNINIDCGSTHMEALQELVKEKQLDLGFAFDGDADRCLAVDEYGNIIDGDMILYITGNYLKENGKLKDDSIVTTVMSNIGLLKALDKAGLSYEITDVGDRNVFEKMLEKGYSLGGEQSGHIIFSKHETTGDGILTAIMLMEVVLEKKSGLAKLSEKIKIYPQCLKNITVRDKDKILNSDKVKQSIKKAETILEGNGRILVRKSGTEPLIRVMVEASDDEICNKCADVIIAAIQEEE